MVEYKINVKESLMDKLLFRNIVNCSVDIIAHSDNGVYYRYDSSDELNPKLVIVDKYTYPYPVEFDKRNNSLTDRGKVSIESEINDLKFSRPGVSELITVTDTNKDPFINDQGQIDYKYRTECDNEFSRIFHTECTVSVVIDSSMYKIPSQCTKMLGKDYLVNFYKMYLCPRMHPMKCVVFRKRINDFIESLERINAEFGSFKR